ncbi:MAG TPA: SRPBCC family protein [Acidimicrobiales bacterium]|nr:SRPBCC family protein [Acidimicrobiales bacterium]
MTTVTHSFDHPLITVFDALADPLTYPEWLLGAKEIRSIDPTWPSPGSSFRHRVGLIGPLTLADSSTVEHVKAPTLLVLEVRARPVGRARVTFRLRASGPATTEVAFSEETIGYARALAPVAGPLAIPRNKRSLDNLEQFLDRDGVRR